MHFNLNYGADLLPYKGSVTPPPTHTYTAANLNSPERLPKIIHIKPYFIICTMRYQKWKKKRN